MTASLLPKLGPYLLKRKIGHSPFGTLFEAEAQDSTLIVTAIDPHYSNLENFIVRFGLIKAILPAFCQENLIPLKALETDGNIYYSVKEYPKEYLSSSVTHLASFSWREAPQPNIVLARLFLSVAKGLIAYVSAFKSIYIESRLPPLFSAKNIILSRPHSLIGVAPYKVQLDHYLEPFLYFGDDLLAALKAQYAQFSYETEVAADGQLPLPFSDAFLFQGEERVLQPGLLDPLAFGFGALIYQVLSGDRPLGDFLPLSQKCPDLAPFWSSLVEEALSGKKGLLELSEALAQFLQESEKTTLQKPPKWREQAPKGMSLVEFDRKVQLGASDGPQIETPPFLVKLKPFFIDQTAVTNEQFRQFLPAYQPSVYSQGDEQPATLISWHMAQAYCHWRSEREGLPKNSYRLPSEYEWEAACRGDLGYQYPWGKAMDRSLVFCGQEKVRGTVPCKSYPPSRFHLYQMLGNACEWTQSPLIPHPFSSLPPKKSAQPLYVVKGGCWFTPYEECRASLRVGYQPAVKLSHIGFRCVRDLSP